jgi:hypothetical protein
VWSPAETERLGRLLEKASASGVTA